MDIKDKEMLKKVLDKKRNHYELTKEEQKWADETLGKLLNSKFKSRIFIVKTGDEIREANRLEKAAGKPASVQPDAPISDERSAFKVKDGSIDDKNSGGAVSEVEEGDNIDVDEKRVGGEDDAQTEAQSENASDIINSDKEDLQRKPVLKYSDVVIKTINGRKYAGLVVKFWPEHNIAQIKWANGTFSNSHIDDLELLTKSYEEERAKLEVPKTDTGKEDVKTPGTDTADENVGLKPGPKKDKVIKAGFPPKKKDNIDTAEEEAVETPEEEAAETPEEQAAEQEAGVEEHGKPSIPEANAVEAGAVEASSASKVGEAFVAGATGAVAAAEAAAFAAGAAGAADAIGAAKEAEDARLAAEAESLQPVVEEPVYDQQQENEWTAKCIEGVSKNAAVKNPKALCSLAYGKVCKSAGGKVTITKDEVAKDNPGLAKYMQDNGHAFLTFETKTGETGEGK